MQGTTEVGRDPFSYTTDGIRWVDPSWLSSVLFYLGYTHFGGVFMVAAKAGFFALAFAFVFVAARGREFWFRAALLAGFAAVASGTTTALRPVVLSMAFQAMTLWVLTRSTNGGPWRAYWYLLPLFALWANLDDWFVLGPITVAVFALGRFISRESSDIRPWIGFVAATFAVCLVNPYLHRVLRLPPEFLLVGVPSELAAEPGIRVLDTRAYSAVFVFPNRVLVNPAAVGFWVLGVVGLLSLTAPATINRPTRSLVWGFFFGLGVLHAKAIPFSVIGLAVVAGSASWSVGSRWVGRRLTRPAFLLAAAGFLLGAWPGWLQLPPYGCRSWNVEVDPSLRDAADRISRLRAMGAIPPDARVFPLSIEAAHYLEWFSPGELVFLDSRWELYAASARDYESLRRWLVEPPPSRAGEEWRQVLARHRIGVILAHDPDRSAADHSVGRMASTPESWALLGVSGRAAVFGWRGNGLSYTGAELNLGRAAFGPGEVRTAPPIPPAVPFRHWTDAFLSPPPATRQFERDEADLYVSLFDGYRAGRHLSGEAPGAAWVGSFIGLLGATGPLAPPNWTFLMATPVSQTGERHRAQTEYGLLIRDALTRSASAGPQAPLYLAIRAGRRAVAANPHDPGGYLVLGEAYLRLAQATREEHWVRAFPEFGEIRRAQAVAALAQAARLDPDAPAPHLVLYGLFRQANATDLALRELRTILRLARRPGGAGGVPPDSVKALEVEIRSLESRVTDLRTRLPAPTDPAGRAEAAVQAGLYGEALDTLLASDYAAFGHRGLRLEVELLLFAGRPGDLLDWITAGHREALGEVGYHWARARAAAAAGDYAEFEAQMTELGGLIESSTDGRRIPFRETIAQGLGRAALAGAVHPATPADLWVAAQVRAEALDQAARLTGGLRQVSKGAVLRGLLALEYGDITRARELFGQALQVWGSEQHLARGEGLDFPGRGVAEEALELIGKDR